jgi:hypothetical protein
LSKISFKLLSNNDYEEEDIKDVNNNNPINNPNNFSFDQENDYCQADSSFKINLV